MPKTGSNAEIGQSQVMVNRLATILMPWHAGAALPPMAWDSGSQKALRP
ncbi:hypothetical protein [Lichenifustis flavocetrariae]